MYKLFDFRFLFIVSILITFNSCQEIIGDCIFWPDRPIIETTSIASGSKDQPFHRSIRCGVENNSNDDGFDYSITLSGNLPPGVSYSTYGRELTLDGIPTEYGTYEITVSVTVLGYNSEEGTYDSENFCFGNNSESKDYTFNIEAF